MRRSQAPVLQVPPRVVVQFIWSAVCSAEVELPYSTQNVTPLAVVAVGATAQLPETPAQCHSPAEAKRAVRRADVARMPGSLWVREEGLGEGAVRRRTGAEGHGPHERRD